MTVKIFGPKRSGTNLLKWILQHYPVKILVDVDRFGEPCWKHGYPRKSADKHIIITKSPVDWHVSYRAFTDLDREQSLEDYRSLCESYREFQQANKDTIWISWSDLVGDWQQGIERITGFLGVEPRSVIEQPSGRLNITADAGKAAQTRGEFAPPDDAGSLICPHEAAILDKEAEGNPRVVHIKQPYNGYGDAMMSLWVCEGLRQVGKVPILYLPPHLLGFTRLWWPHYQVCPVKKAPEWAHDIGFERLGNPELRQKSHTQVMWERLPAQLTQGAVPKAPRLLDHREVVSSQRHVLLFPASAHRLRQWPTEHWARLAAQLTAEGYEVGVCLPPNMKEESRRIHPNGVSTDDWSEIILRMREAGLIISNDSGPAHIAGTLGRPTLAIHAMQSPVIYSPYESVTSIYPDNTPCAGCCGCEAHGFNKRTCDPNATENNRAISQPNPETNPNGGVFGPGCPELKGIGPGRVVGEVFVRVLG